MELNQKELWDEFYTDGQQVYFPSEFAKYVLPQLNDGLDILDVGCGNGRDSIFFANNGINVTAIDMCDKAIEHIRKNEPKVCAVCEDVVTSSIFEKNKYDGIYTRFFIHAITAKQEEILLSRCYNAIRKGGKIFIEVRSIEDELCGLGEKMSDTEWVLDGHYRRFIIPEVLKTQLSRLGFIRIQSVCSRGFAPFQDMDPVVLRIVAEK